MSEFLAKQERRIRTVLKSFRAANVEQRIRVVRFVCNRLPLPASSRQACFRWLLEKVIDTSPQSPRTARKKAQLEWKSTGELRLSRLLGGDEVLALPEGNSPRVSFILVLHSRAELSVLTIDSIVEHADTAYEVIVVDNGSTDATLRMVQKLRGAAVIRNERNLGFGPACMQAVRVARGEYLCFLNNDAILTPGSLSAAVKLFADPSVGAVGGKILLSNGDLQEAGSIVWRDGSALGYGRGDNPEAPQYDFRRAVDYCSAVFLVTPRELFLRLGGFSPDFAPAYYEDTDYCLTLWDQGFRVLYEPEAVVRHYESASSGGNDHAVALMASHQEKFRNKWRDVLERYYLPAFSDLYTARVAARSGSLRILYLDDRIPHRALGSGFPRSNEIVTQLAALGHQVTCVSLTLPLLSDEYSDLPRDIELVDGFRNRQPLLGDYIASSDIIWVSRPHNLHRLISQGLLERLSGHSRLVYDAEAIFSERAIQKAQITGADRDANSEFDEIELAKRADRVVVVSEADKATMVAAGLKDVWVIGHALSPYPTAKSFSERNSFLFVGAVHGTDTPNADSIRFFCESVWPAVAEKAAATLVIAGYGTDDYLGHLEGPRIQVLGPQSDLTPYYDAARVFIVPTRYAAGVPFKAHEAAAFGVPLVVSGVIDRQVKWRDGLDYLVAGDAQTFAEQCIRLYSNRKLWDTLRTNELLRVKEELGPEKLAGSVRRLVESIKDAGQMSHSVNGDTDPV